MADKVLFSKHVQRTLERLVGRIKQSSRPMTMRQYEQYRQALVTLDDPAHVHERDAIEEYLNDIKVASHYLGGGCARDAYLMLVRGCVPFVLKVPTWQIEWEVAEGVAPSAELDDGGSIAQMTSEIDHYKYTDHPYIPKLYDWDPKGRWLEMEFLLDCNEVDRLSPRGRIFPADYERMMHGLEVDDCGFDNLGYNAQGEFKLLDFGIR